MTDEEPRSKNYDSALMGRAGELLVAASCIIASRGALNVSTSLVDDEGVDLVFHRRGGTKTLAVQVKTRFDDANTLKQGQSLADVRSQTFRPRDDFYLLAVAAEIGAGSFDMAWLVPSPLLAARVKPNTKGKLRFAASMKPGTQDQWSSHRVTRVELAERLLALLS